MNMATFAPTAQQQAFLDALTGTTSNLALLARAGCGKTATILMGVDAIAKQQPQAEILVCAFNKAIASEVEGKLKAAGHTDWRTVQTSTLHALGFNLVKFAFKSAVDGKKVRNLIRQAGIKNSGFDTYASQIASLVGYAKGAGFGFFADKQIGDAAAWYALADHFDVGGYDSDTSDMDQIISYSQVIYRASLDQTDIVDFDDMILFPLVKNLRVRFGKDVVFVDEAQDLSPARQALIRKFVKFDGGRMIVVGDDRQAIYGFSGADAEALPNMIASLNATVLPLSVTWRCPAAVVRAAQAYVPDIMAADDADEGAVVYNGHLPTDIGAGDAILCRNTAPLIDMAYRLIRNGHAAKVEGRSIGDGLKSLVNRWKVADTATLLIRLDGYADREIQKAMAKDNEAKAEEVADRVETMRHIIAAVNAGGSNRTADVIGHIDSLFADDAANAIILATYHRSKGREWNRVYLFEHATRCPSKAAKQAWQKGQEANLAYVAITRAKKMLTFI
jgi:superfamily I DNA/RNA helicase